MLIRNYTCKPLGCRSGVTAAASLIFCANSPQTASAFSLDSGVAPDSGYCKKSSGVRSYFTLSVSFKAMSSFTNPTDSFPCKGQVNFYMWKGIRDGLMSVSKYTNLFSSTIIEEREMRWHFTTWNTAESMWCRSISRYLFWCYSLVYRSKFHELQKSSNC